MNIEHLRGPTDLVEQSPRLGRKVADMVDLISHHRPVPTTGHQNLPWSRQNDALFIRTRDFVRLRRNPGVVRRVGCAPIGAISY